MIYVWLQSIAILSLVFSGGLWLGGSLSNWMANPAARVAPTAIPVAEEPAVPPHFDFAPEPAPAPVPAPAPEPETVPLPFVAEPPVPLAAPSPVKRWELLYPANQFGTISETRAPVSA